MLDRVTPLILTYNEAANIERVLRALSWARDIVVVDSQSSDATRAILAQHANVRVFERPFTTHEQQWNFALEQTEIQTEWVLALDADYVLSDELVEELTTLCPDNQVRAYRASFTYCIEGKPLRAAAYPPVVVLFRRAGARFAQDGHTQRIRTQGAIAALHGRILHDDRKPLAHWLAAQARYMELEAAKLLGTRFSALSVPDKIRRFVLVAPPLMFFYCLLFRGNILDGRVGLIYSLQRAIAEAILSICLLSASLRRQTTARGQPS